MQGEVYIRKEMMEMRVICAAVVEDWRQRKNLCDCINILGGQSTLSGETVCVEYDGDTPIISKFTELFQNYVHHEIRTQA